MERNFSIKAFRVPIRTSRLQDLTCSSEMVQRVIGVGTGNSLFARKQSLCK